MPNTRDIENVKTAINEVVRSMRAGIQIEKRFQQQKRKGTIRNQSITIKELEMISIERISTNG